MTCKACPVGCACSCSTAPSDHVNGTTKAALNPIDASPPRINDNKDTLKVMCVEGHGRSLFFEVDNFDDELPPWVQHWMDKHAADCGGTICCPKEDGYESNSSSSALSVESVKEGASAFHGPGLSVILLSDSDSDIDE